MDAGQRTRKSAGTHGLIGVLRHPSLMFKPSPEQSQGDLQAVRRGEARTVSCFLRGSFATYPRRLRQGTLYLSALDVHWVPFWSVRRLPQQITGPVLSVTTRPADDRETKRQERWQQLLERALLYRDHLRRAVRCRRPSGA